MKVYWNGINKEESGIVACKKTIYVVTLENGKTMTLSEDSITRIENDKEVL